MGITFDSDFAFEEHINKLCRKAIQTQRKKRLLFETFIMSQFNYCPLVWMCHSSGPHTKINNIHKRALRIVYQDKKSTLQEDLLEKDHSVPIHKKNLQYLATEIYKVKN